MGEEEAVMEPGRQFKQLQMFATPAEVGQMKSGDYAYRPMSSHEVRTNMEEYYGIHHDARTGEKHYDLDSYTDSLNHDADVSGGFEVPIRVHHFTNGSTGQPDAAVVNGHHRYVAAAKSNRLLPVIHSDYESGSSTHDAMVAGQRDETRREWRLKDERG